MRIGVMKPAGSRSTNPSISVSSLGTFQACRVMSKLGREGWTPLRTSAALQFGEIAHAVLEAVYNEVQEGKRKSPPTEAEVLKHIQKQADIWESGPRGQRAGAEQIQQMEQNLVLLEAVLPEYFRYWAKEDFKEITWVGQEVAFDIDFDITVNGKPETVKLRGRIDALYRDKAKALAEFETKTKGRIEDNLVDLLAFDFQTDVYGLVCQTLYGEYPKLARYNIIRRPGEKLKKGEKLSAYRARIAAEVKKDPAYYFVRYRITKSKKEFENFKAELANIIEEFLKWNRGELKTFKNYNSCVGKFGACRFLPICAHGNYSGFYKRNREVSK